MSEQKKQVLYISYDGMTDFLGQSQVLPYLAGLSKLGYHFHLISFEKPDRFKKFRGDIQSLCDTHHISWYPLSYTKKPPLLSTLYDVWRMQRLAFKLHQQHAFSIVHCRSYLAALVGLKLKRRHGVKFVFDMRGFWADERVDGGLWNLANPIYNTVYNFFKRKENEFFNQADHIVSLTEEGKKELLSWEKVARKETDVTVIPCCVDTNLFNPEAINPDQKRKLKESLNIANEEFILGYVGSIGTWYMLDEMLAFFKILLTKNMKAKFLFITGEDPLVILGKAKELEIPTEKLVVVSSIHKYVPLHISLFDYSIFFIRPSFSKKASSPTKQGEIMAMGIPLICNSGVGDTDTIVKKYNSGIVLEELSDISFQAVDLHTHSFLPQILREGAINYFSLTKGVELYDEILR